MAASGRSSAELPAVQRARLSDPAPFERLQDCIVVIILQSLPSLTDLVRAACTCRRWRQLASERAFRRRFRATHPPLVLGLFFNPAGQTIPAIPSFSPVRHDDADLAKVILGGDFLLTPLYVRPHVVPPRWYVADSRCGWLLLIDWQTLRLALVNPLQKTVEGYFNVMDLDILEGWQDGPQNQFLEPRLICSEDHPSRFRIVFLRHDERRVQIGLFADTIREGMILEWLDAPGRPSPNQNENRDDWLHDGMVAGGFIYWFYKNYRHAIVLNMANLQYYAQEIPPSVYVHAARYYALGEDVPAVDEEPHTCSPHIVYARQNRLWRLTGGAPGNVAIPWVRSLVKDLGPDIQGLFMDLNMELPEGDNQLVMDLNMELPEGDNQLVMDLNMELPEGDNQLVIFALRDGFVYFTTSHLGQDSKTWFCSLSLETGQVDKLLWRRYDARFQPYTMPWPCFLLGDPENDDNGTGDDGPSPCGSSVGDTDWRQDEQDGPSSAQQMNDLASGSSSSNRKQLMELSLLSLFGEGPVQDVLKWNAPCEGTCKAKQLLSEKKCTEICYATLKILMDHHRKERDMAMKFYSMMMNYGADAMQYSTRKMQMSGGSSSLPAAYQCRMVQSDQVKTCYRQLAHMLLKEFNQAHLRQ